MFDSHYPNCSLLQFRQTGVTYKLKETKDEIMFANNNQDPYTYKKGKEVFRTCLLRGEILFT